jgi:PAS domain S-box-containing protein
MSHDVHHEHIMKELSEQLEPLFVNSPQAIYLYLDDTHKTCNQKFADMLGYASIQEWVENEYPVEDVAEEDREKGIKTYMHASEDLVASTIEGTLISKKGKRIKAEVTMVPLPYRNEIFVLHFISEKK